MLPLKNIAMVASKSDRQEKVKMQFRISLARAPILVLGDRLFKKTTATPVSMVVIAVVNATASSSLGGLSASFARIEQTAKNQA